MKHIHKFVIPVEFEHYGQVTLYDGRGSVSIVLNKTRVTVLRCACGEEKERTDENI